MADDLCDETTIPRARAIAKQALNSLGYNAISEECITDLIANLMHLADEHLPGDPDEIEDDATMGYAVMYRARDHYEAELPERETADV